MDDGAPKLPTRFQGPLLALELGVLLAAGGCLPELGLEVAADGGDERRDGGDGRRDGGSEDGALRTDATVDAGGLDGGLEGHDHCGFPQLLVASSAREVSAPGAVLRFRLELGLVERCDVLTGSGLLMSEQDAVAYFAPARIAVAGPSGIAAIDPRDDSMVWSWPVEGERRAVDLFPLRDSDGAPRVGVAWSGGDGLVDLVEVYSAGGTLISTSTSSILPTSNVNAMTAHPQDPRKTAALTDGAATEVLDLVTREWIGHLPSPNSEQLSTVYAMPDPDVPMVWAETGNRSSSSIWLQRRGELVQPSKVCSDCEHLMHAVGDPRGQGTFQICRSLSELALFRSHPTRSCTRVGGTSEEERPLALQRLAIQATPR